MRRARHRAARRVPSWPSRLAWGVVGALAVLFVVLVIRNLRRHDALTEWRQQLEEAANRPAWPPWSETWPALPTPAHGRHQLPRDLHGAYAYAALHPKVLGKIPCFCGCAREGHDSVLRCFVSGFRSDGVPVWTDHSFGCPMCVHIARETMLMRSLGMSMSEVRRAITDHYRDQGPSNMAVAGAVDSGRE